MNHSKFEVVITDSPYPDSSVEEELLGKIGAVVKKYQILDETKLREIVKTADGILCDYAQITREVISKCEKTRVIVITALGTDNVDINAATEKGILVCNTVDFMTFEVAHHTLALILSLWRRIPWANTFTKSGAWSKTGTLAWRELMPIHYIDGKVAGIIGLGRIGKQVAELLQAFRTQVIAYDPYVSEEAAAKAGVKLVDLPTLMSQSDIISVNASLSEQTYRLVSEKEIRLMKRTAMIVNTSRGKIIDQKALVEALLSKRIAGAALDVLETEPPEPESPILKLDNIILSPHIAGASEKSVIALRQLASEEMARVLMGEAPKHPVNPEVLMRK